MCKRWELRDFCNWPCCIYISESSFLREQTDLLMFATCNLLPVALMLNAIFSHLIFKQTHVYDWKTNCNHKRNLEIALTCFFAPLNLAPSTSDAMSSKPRHCLSFSFCSRFHISGSSWARLSWPVQGRSSSAARVAAWDWWARALRQAGTRWHSGCGWKTSWEYEERKYRKEKVWFRVCQLYTDIAVTVEMFSKTVSLHQTGSWVARVWECAFVSIILQLTDGCIGFPGTTIVYFPPNHVVLFVACWKLIISKLRNQISLTW